MPEQKVKVTYTKSAIGYQQNQKDTLRALGLRQLGHSVEHTLTPAIKGMLAKVAHLVKVEEVKS
jgi:large subunit ribosomal protein L30